MVKNELMVCKSILITEEQNDWLEKQPLNFSGWVRKKIDELMG